MKIVQILKKFLWILYLKGFKIRPFLRCLFFKTAGCNVIGYRDKHGKQLVNPDASLSLSTKGTLIVLGTTQSLKKLNAIFKRD